MSKIRVMDEILANKIAAGEVIEKLASIVKELTENSIDAGSKNIIIELKNAGMDEIKVTDDGEGMDKIDAKECFLRHATSKIYKEDDLYFIDTLGFRGEALASIASVSEINLKTCNGKESTYIHLKGGVIDKVAPCEERKGTSISVTNVFYNTPARLKYLKSEASELASITSFVEKLALSEKDIAFTLKNNDKEIVKTSGSGNILKVVHEIYGANISSNMLEIKNSDNDFVIYGYACKPHILKSTKNHMITFINNRVIKNYDINEAINDAYYTYKPEGKYPVVVLYIETDPTVVDVNIHPTKQDVKISKITELKNLITATIKKALYESLLIVKPLEDEKTENNNYERMQINNKMNAYDINNIFSKKSNDETIVVTNEEEIKKDQYFMNFEKNDIIKNEELKSLKLYPVGLALGTYIIAENEDGIYLLDQHAAYERINYERYMQKLKEKKVVKIGMLIPITIEFTSSEFNIIKGKLDMLESIGIDAEEFGINTLIIKTHPSYLKEGYEEESVRKIIDIILNTDKDFDRVKFEEKIAITLACKMSIKANHHISMEEITYILDELVKCDNPYNCPHGRPTIIKFSIYDLEKMFKRVMD